MMRIPQRISLLVAVSLPLFACSLDAQVRVEKDRPLGVTRAPFKCVVPARLRAPDRADSLFAAMLDMAADTIHRDRTAPSYSKTATACVDSLVRGLLRWAPAPPPVDTTKPTPTPPDTAKPTPTPPDTAKPNPNPSPNPTPTPSGNAALPAVFLNTDRPASTRTLRVAAGGNLQAAIDSAKRGDVILLASGATYGGNYACRAKPGAGWVTIRSDVPDLAAGERVTPASAAPFARVLSTNSAAAFDCGQGTRGYRFEYLNVECSNAGPPAINYNCIAFGDTHATSYAAQGGRFVVSQSWVHGTSTTNMQRCIALNSDSTAIVDSWVSDCHAAGFDSQAAAGWNGPGPFKIVNNYLEGAGENVMFGGADPEINGLIPSDIEIRNNHFFKVMSWRGVFTVKNLFELKNSRRTLVEGNVFENNWADAQQGFAILFKSVNQDNRATWSQTVDLTFRNNVVQCSPSGLTLLAVEYYPAQPLTRAYVGGNFFDQIGTCNGSTAGRQFMFLGGLQGATVERNTVRGNAPNTGAWLILDNAAGATGLVVRDNVSSVAGIYDAEFMNGAGGAAALAAFSSAWTYTGNVIGGLNPGLVFRAPPNNSYPPTVTVSAAGVASSTVSTTGKGADPATIANVIAKAVVPWPASHPRTTPGPIARGAGTGSSDWWQRACAARGETIGRSRGDIDPCAARGLRRAPR